MDWKQSIEGQCTLSTNVLQVASRIPVEVKAGARGSMKSMRLFLKEYPETVLGIRYSIYELSYFDQILSIPLYMISQTQRLVQSCINKKK